MTATSPVPLAAPAERTAVDLGQLRHEVQAFLADARATGVFRPTVDCWLRGFDLRFSRELSARGWLGVTWPERFGGRNWPNAARFVITEELLRFGAPITAHWMGDRQIGPSLLRHGTPELQHEFLPKIVASEVTFCICMSEPNAGSDLAALATRAAPAEGGWLVNGTKIWTSHAQHASHGYLLARTSRGENRHDGLTEFIIDMDWPGITVTPIADMSGGRHFNEVAFRNVLRACQPDTRGNRQRLAPGHRAAVLRTRRPRTRAHAPTRSLSTPSRRWRASRTCTRSSERSSPGSAHCATWPYP